MASRADTANFDLLVSRNSIREDTRKALRLFVGRGRQYSVKELSNGSGVPERMIESAMCGVDTEDYRPLSLEALASIGKFIGAPFVSAVLACCGLGAFDLMDQAPLGGVLTPGPAPLNETIPEKRRRLLRELQALEDGE